MINNFWLWSDKLFPSFCYKSQSVSLTTVLFKTACSWRSIQHNSTDTPRFKPATLQKVIKHVVVFTLLYFFLMKLNKTANFVTTEEYTSYSTCYSQNNIFYEYFFHWNYYNSANKRSIRAILIMYNVSCIISYTLLPLDHGIFSGEVEWLMVAGNKC